MRVIEHTREIQTSEPVNHERISELLSIAVSTPRRRSSSKKALDRKTPIVVLEGNVEESFGAELVTEGKQRDGQLFYKHVFKRIQRHGPAYDMMIENHDEILFIDDEFTQEISHDEVLELFRNVKVDGRTRFALIVRRSHRKRYRKAWRWIKTSAILVPEPRPLDAHPAVEDIRYKKVENNRVEFKSTQRYKVFGTQLYLDIQDNKVTADVFTDTARDKTKIICKRQRYWQDADGQVHFVAALCDEKLQNYIAVGPKNKIILQDEPIWFEQTLRGSDILFRHKDLYLAYNRDIDQVDAQTSEFAFEEYPGDVDISDLGVNGESEITCSNFNTLKCALFENRFEKLSLRDAKFDSAAETETVVWVNSNTASRNNYPPFEIANQNRRLNKSESNRYHSRTFANIKYLEDSSGYEYILRETTV